MKDFAFIIVIQNIKSPNLILSGGVKNKYKGAYKKIFDILNEDFVFVDFESEDEELIGNDFYLYFNLTPDLDKIERILKIPNVAIISQRYGQKGLLAPNGKPSNLNAEQYKLVRTPAFKSWFGDWENDPANASKVVDEETREPLVVYHGGKTKNINIFDIEKSGSIQNSDWGKGIYFTPYKSTANYYSNEAIIKADRLYNDFYEVYEKTQDFEDLKRFQQRGRELRDNKQTVVYEVFLNIRNPFFEVIESMNYTDPFLSRQALENGNDGLIILNGREEFDELLVFKSSQIKLADGTNTTFDSRNDDIIFENGGRTISQTPSPKKDQIVGSDVNKKSSSKNLSSAKLIKFDEKTLGAIKNKVKKHNEEHLDKKINLASAKAVVRRGMGAYSGSHRPTISGGKPNSRVAWGLARLNAFTYKIVNGKSKSGKYTQDDDLIEELGFKVADYKNGGEMKKDIRCINCGWEWNRKDSELWDMYVCHKCGFDNTSFYTSDPINRLLKGGGLNSVTGVSPDYLKMFLDL